MARRTIPLIICFVCGWAMVIAYFIPAEPFPDLRDKIQMWYLIILSGSILLGVFNLFKISMLNVIRRREKWGYSLVLVFSFLLMAVPGLIWGLQQTNPEAGFTKITPAWFLVDYFYLPLGSTMFATLAFYVASAAYRAFRAKTTEATLLLVAAFFVMLGRVPIGAWLSNMAGVPKVASLPSITTYIMNFPNMAGVRAIMIGIALGIVSASLRIILGYERPYMGGGSK